METHSQHHQIRLLAIRCLQPRRVRLFLSRAYFLNGYRENLKKIQDKYNFGFQDYLKANLIYERALAVNRLEELLEKRGKFDWTNVPELPV
jgi:hypothetical protein